MEIVQIDLALRLELVDEIKETEGEHSTRAMPGGRKPAGTKKLDATIARPTFTSVFTKAVGDPNRMDARDIEERESSWRGGENTWVTNRVSKLIGHA